MKLSVSNDTKVKFDLKHDKLHVKATDPEALLADIVAHAGLPVEQGQIIALKGTSSHHFDLKWESDDGLDVIEIRGSSIRLWCSAVDDSGFESAASWSRELTKSKGCNCECICDCPANTSCDCNCDCGNPKCACECTDNGVCTCSNQQQGCNQGVGNGPEGCDPGNSNQGDDDNSNDENGGEPGNPGKKGGNGGDDDDGGGNGKGKK